MTTSHKVGPCPIGFFRKSGFTPQQRAQLFFAVCIFVRLAIAGVAYVLSDKMYLYYALIVVSALAIYGNYRRIGTSHACVWWPSWFHLIIASLLFIVAVLTVSKVAKTGKYAAYLLYIDVFVGLVVALYLQPWSR